MLYSLPPVGQRIEMKAGASLADDSQLASYFDSNFPYVYFFSCGAEALAASILAVIETSHVKSPEVILPAYTCPEVVSAVLYAGATPILVDLVQDHTWMDLDQLASKLSDKTIAVIAINFLGIPDRIDSIRELTNECEIKIIEDCAQAFPVDDNENFYQGDLVVHSFGRGKPVSVLGGGVVVCRDLSLISTLDRIKNSLTEKNENVKVTKLKITAYNLLISPYCYWLPESLPFLKLGQTVFHPMEKLQLMDGFRKGLLSVNIIGYRDRSDAIQNGISKIVEQYSSSGVIDLSKHTDNSHFSRLLRYPLLFADAQSRDAVFEVLDKQGLGASKLYKKSLPKIQGLEQILSTQAVFPQAESFASRLLTLPTHTAVMDKQVEKISLCFDKVFK